MNPKFQDDILLYLFKSRIHELEEIASEFWDYVRDLKSFEELEAKEEVKIRDYIRILRRYLEDIELYGGFESEDPFC